MALLDLPDRRIVPELMDADTIAFEVFRDCLRDLARVNAWTFAYRPTLLWLDRLVRRHGTARPLRILDVGAGYGDMLRQIAGWADRRGIAVDLAAVDLNPLAARAAREAAAAPPIRYRTANLFELDEEEAPDVVISSLFAHHLEDRDIPRFLRWMEERAALGWFVNDLHRNQVPLAFARGFRALPLHFMIKHDGPVSVARAFVHDDWADYLAQAGLDRFAAIEWFFPFRLCVGRIR